MYFVTGGAYQGKFTFAKQQYGVTEDTSFTCGESGEIDYSKRCIRRIEEYTLWCVRNGVDPTEEFKKHRDEWAESVLICRDIFCGVVPLGSDMRAWRDATGRLCVYLSGQADAVTRLFCGLPQRLK